MRVPVRVMAEGASLVLVGLMGSGKTTVGRRLAERLGWRFVDLDHVVAGARSVAEVFEQEGEPAFRQKEAEALAAVLADAAPAVVATGGGAVLDAGTRRRLAEQATVWLRGAPSALAARVGQGEGRPLLAAGEVLATLERLAGEREPLYHEVAGIVVDVDGLAVDEVVDRILASALLVGVGGAPS